MGLEGWTECTGHAAALAEAWTRHIKKIDADFIKLTDQFDRAMNEARASAPSRFTYRYNPYTNKLITASQRAWRKRSLTCTRHLGKCDRLLTRMEKLAEKYPQVLMSRPERMRRHRDYLRTVRKSIRSRAGRKSVTD